MAKVVEQFAAQLESADSQIVADLCDFVAWQTQQHRRSFKPDAIDDVAVRSYLLHLKLGGSTRTILQRTIASLKCFCGCGSFPGCLDESIILSE
jgi:hypothetical protein